eukprot:g16471.t1
MTRWGMSPTMNFGMCYRGCVARNESSFGLQNGNECWCNGPSDLDYDYWGEGANCNMTCVGAEHKTCGGYESMSVWEIRYDVPVYFDDDDYDDDCD